MLLAARSAANLFNHHSRGFIVTTMQLPYSEHQVSSPLEESIATVLAGAPSEIELAASLSFPEEEYDGEILSDTGDIYFRFFQQTADEISERLGPAIYNGRMPDALDWVDVLGTVSVFDEIFVWEKDGRKVYLLYIWENRDCPIVVSLGAA
ncbi:MAG: hypothetical protein LBO00_04420 [Zoogloeaceae bacterium]|jgi:hypothetical protein|nr:hypothetical protein [Zoogloeaceae bacterium]